MNKSVKQLEYELKNARAHIEELQSSLKSHPDETSLINYIFQNMSEGVCIISARNSHIVYSNPVFDSMFGYAAGELNNTHVSIINAKDIISEELAKEIIRSTDNTGHWQGEVRNQKKDGSALWCHAKVIKYYSPQYGPVYISIHQDISEKKLIEDALINQKSFDKRLFETAQFIILVLDVEGLIVKFNPYMEALTGYKQNEVTGKDWFTTFLPGTDQDEIRCFFKQSVNEINNSNINPILTKDGKEICIEWYNTSLIDVTGITIGVLAIGHNITEKRIIQNELENTYTMLKDIQETMDLVGIGLHILDPQDGHFIYVNNAACEMLGYSKEEMLTMSVSDIDPNYQGDFSELVKHVPINEPGMIETTQVKKNGDIIPAEVIFHYFPDKESDRGRFFSFITDLTERKRIEAEHRLLQKQLLQAQKMESIGHITGGVAHDFNNMLAAILGYAVLIDKQFDNKILNDEKSKKYLDEIIKAADRARELISQMLIFSRTYSDDKSDDTGAILVAPVIEEVTNLLKSSIPSTIELKITVSINDLYTCIQPVHLHQILLNLFINARDAIGEYGVIDISLEKHTTEQVCSSCHKHFSGDYVVIKVSDSGSGINDQQLQHIFEPFFTTKEIGKGTGMGLSVVHGIVHSANGHILVSSDGKNGTSISIVLPVVADSIDRSDTTQSKTDLDMKLTGLRIMIVDDERQIASMMAEIFEMHGAETHVYNRSTEALAFFTKDPDAIDLILTDETMPELSGLDMSKIILAARPELPIIISTGYSEHVNPKIARQQGIAGFLINTINIEKLLHMVMTMTKVNN